MPQSSNQENLAGRFQSSRYNDGYDCELPPDVRAEFAKPKRPRILERAIQESPRRLHGVLKWLAAVAIPALILVCVISSWQRERQSAFV
jgi:hypothetical protein